MVPPLNLKFAAIAYRAIRDRIRAEDPQIDEQILADTVDGLTDIPEIIGAIIRAALCDEALATGIKGRIAEMEERLRRLQERSSKDRQRGDDRARSEEDYSTRFFNLDPPGSANGFSFERRSGATCLLGTQKTTAQATGIARRT